MQIKIRSYSHTADYERVNRFLVKTYRTTGEHINWLQPRWEYMHYHPYIERVDLDSIGVWEADGEVVGVVHPEHSMGFAYFQIDPAYGYLKPDMLKYAEEHLAVDTGEHKTLRIYINDRDDEFRETVLKMGYGKVGRTEPMSDFAIPDPFPEIELPDGFRLQSLAEDNDLRKVHRVLWRGFGHGDEPPDDGIKEREFMQSAPNFRNDLNVVVVAPDGNFVSYCGMWYEPLHQIAYVEPVATDPDYRKMGLGKWAVLEGIRRCGVQGAGVAYVGSDMPFYGSIGFSQIYNLSMWEKYIK